MWKKNKLPILLLAVVAMLSVFYIYASNQGAINVSRPDTQGPIPGESQQPVFAQKRLRLLQERTERINELELEIASGDLSYDQIAVRVSIIDEITYIKTKEAVMERAIERELGFPEVFVEYVGRDALVYVLADSLTVYDVWDVSNLVRSNLNNVGLVEVINIPR